MSKNFRRAGTAAGLATAGILTAALVAACGSSSGGGSAATTTDATTSNAVAVTSVQTPTSGTPPAATGKTASGTDILIVFRNGKVQGGLPHVNVKQNDQVTLQVRADVSDEVHLHGYDIMRDVAPGKPATIRFKATIPGRFEAELESRSLQILDLEVRP